MPELPDVCAYIEALGPRVVGQPLHGIRIAGPSLLRTVEPPLERFAGMRVTRLHRLGKRIALEMEQEHWLVVHLMVAGRLHWRQRPGAKIPRRRGLAALDFPKGTLLLTEAGTKRRASLHAVVGRQAADALHRHGLEVLQASLEEFRAAIVARNRTLKRALTDPSICSGIGNAYSDEILHRARLSPLALTRSLGAESVERLYSAARSVLQEWTRRLCAEARERFPERVTAFREGMAVHGRFRQPCPVCGAPVQRIRHASSEVNYCARCQTGGKLLRDRALSRLLRSDWPRSLDDLSSS